jgi:predicted DCC family thiol-disulfide oxidoreductase YuxK
LGLVASVTLLVGIFRRFAAVLLPLISACFVVYGRFHWGLGAALGLLALVVATYPGEDLRIRSIGEVRPASARGLAFWFPASRVASVLALSTALLGVIAEPSLGSVAVTSLVVGLAALASFDEKWLPPVGEAEAIVFFDGQCIFCNGAVYFIIREEQRAALRFAPLEGETAQEVASELLNHPTGSIVLHTGGFNHVASDAALRIARAMGGFWRLVWVFRFVPLSVREAAYYWFAGNRYRWFGKVESCPIPPKELRGRFMP